MEPIILNWKNGKINFWPNDFKVNLSPIRRMLYGALCTPFVKKPASRVYILGQMKLAAHWQQWLRLGWLWDALRLASWLLASDVDSQFQFGKSDRKTCDFDFRVSVCSNQLEATYTNLPTHHIVYHPKNVTICTRYTWNPIHPCSARGCLGTREELLGSP